MSAPDALPAVVGLPLALLAWIGAVWPAIRPHRWVGGYMRECIAHERCREVYRFYNDRGVRLCESFAWLEEGDDGLRRHCDLHHGHRPRVHYNIAADRTWT